MVGREYFRKYSKTYYRQRRSELLNRLGGECVICGSTENLEFDHVDPNTKSLSIGKLLSYSKETVDEELKKCQLLCKECHKAKTKEYLKQRPVEKRWTSPFDSKSKFCICDNTQQIFYSASDAARYFNLSASMIMQACKGKIRHHVHGLSFKYLE